MPAKYQPDYGYLRHVPIKRVHLFTAIQVVCLILLWIVKTIKIISIAFPLMVGIYQINKIFEPAHEIIVYFSSSVDSFFKRTCAAIQWG